MKLSRESRIGIINIYSLIVILTSNIIYGAANNYTVDKYMLFVAPLVILFIIAVISFISRSMHGYGILYFLASLFFVFLGDRTDCGAAIFAIFSMSCFNNKTINILILSAVLFILLVKFAVLRMGANDIFIVSIFYSSAFGLNYYINQKEANNGT